jgi:hypothetical protein
MVKQYLFLVIHIQCLWQSGEICSNGHGSGEEGTAGVWYWKVLLTRTLEFEKQKYARRYKSSEVALQ